jgi:hypothetical protein
MKLFAALLFCLAALAASAADRITAVVTITNAPTTNGMTFVVNADTRTWTNSVANPATQILTNDTVNGVATNLYLHLVATPPANVVVYLTDTNVLRLDARTGSALSVAGVTNYFSVTYSTQTVSTAYDVLVPYTAVPSVRRQTITEGLVDWLNQASGKALYETNAAMSNLVGRANSQTISGNKTFTGTLTVSGTISNGVAYLGSATLSGALGWGSTADYPGLDLNNLTSAERDSLETEAVGSMFFNEDLGKVQVATAADTFVTLATEEGTTIATILGVTSDAGGNDLDNLGNLEATGIYALSGQGAVNNLTANGTNSFSDIAFRRYAITSLANGNNAGIVVGTNTFVEVSGPSGAFTLNGLTGSPSRDGHLVVVVNQTGFDMTVAHQSGTDPTAANRIISLTGADRATTGNGAATFIYSAAASRWLLIALDP